MPVGATPPAAEQLEKLRAQTADLLAESALCPDGGRVLAVRKIGGLSARKVAYWFDKGEYPSGNIPACRHDELCVDCGRFAVDGTPEPDPPAIAPPPPVPQPAPAPAAAPASGAGLEPVGAGPPTLRVGGLVPVSVPGPVPDGRGLPRWLWWVPALVAGVAVVLVAVTVAVQGLAFGVSTLRESLPEVDVEIVTTTTTAGM